MDSEDFSFRNAYLNPGNMNETQRAEDLRTFRRDESSGSHPDYEDAGNLNEIETAEDLLRTFRRDEGSGSHLDYENAGNVNEIQRAEDLRTFRRDESSGFQSDYEDTTSDFDPEDLVRLEDQIMDALASGNALLLKEIWESNEESDVWLVLQAARDEDGFTPLHIAVITGRFDVVLALFSCSTTSTAHGSDGPGGSFTYFDFLHARTRKGQTAIHLAVVSGDEEILKFLIGRYNLITKRPASSWDFADRYWMTPLHYAILGNQTAQMEQLLNWQDYNRHVNARDYFQRTPLHFASCHRSVPVEILLQHPNLDINAKDCLSQTPLHWAVYFGRTDVVRCLVEQSSESRGERTIQAVGRDVEDRSVLTIAMEDSLLDLIPTVSETLPRRPFIHDKWFMEETTPTIHNVVNVEIEKLLWTCPDVSKEAEGMEKNLVIYVNATNAILVVATLIAGASVSMSFTDISDGSQTIFSRLFFFKLLSFYGSVATVLAGVTILRLLGRSIPVGRRVGFARRALRRITLTLDITVAFFIAAFYVGYATDVIKFELAAMSIPYHMVSAFGLLVCFGFTASFEELANIVSQVEIGMENTSSSIHLLTMVILHTKVGRFSNLIYSGFQHYMALKRELHLSFKLKKVSSGYLVSDGSQFWDTSKQSYENVSDEMKRTMKTTTVSVIRSYVASQSAIYYVNRREWIAGLWLLLYGEYLTHGYFSVHFKQVANQSLTDSGQLRDLDPAEILSYDFANYYWRRQEASSYDRELFKLIEEELLDLEKLYERLSIGIGSPNVKIDERAKYDMSFLSRLPRGIFFWISDHWVKIWTKQLALFYRGYVFERDFKMFKQVSLQMTTTRQKSETRHGRMYWGTLVSNRRIVFDSATRIHEE